MLLISPSFVLHAMLSVGKEVGVIRCHRHCGGQGTGLGDLYQGLAVNAAKNDASSSEIKTICHKHISAWIRVGCPWQFLRRCMIDNELNTRQTCYCYADMKGLLIQTVCS